MKYIDIYELIVKYYPIGINELEPIYQEYKGYQLLQQLCFNKMEPIQFDTWTTFVNEFKHENLQILNANEETTLFDRSYNAVFLLYKEEIGTLTYFKELNLKLSVIGGFYTIYGSDRIVVNQTQEQAIRFNPVLTVSPIGIYEPWFSLLRSSIEGNYKVHKFIPYYLLKKRIKLLSVNGANLFNNPDASVFQAFFTFEDLTSYPIRGDIFYE